MVPDITLTHWSQDNNTFLGGCWLKLTTYFLLGIRDTPTMKVASWRLNLPLHHCTLTSLTTMTYVWWYAACSNIAQPNPAPYSLCWWNTNLCAFSKNLLISLFFSTYKSFSMSRGPILDIFLGFLFAEEKKYLRFFSMSCRALCSSQIYFMSVNHHIQHCG